MVDMADFLRRRYEAGDPLARRILDDSRSTVRLPPRFVTGFGRGLRGFSSSWDDEPGKTGQDVYDVPQYDEWTPEWREDDPFGNAHADPLPQPFGGGGPEYWQSGRGAAFDRPYNPYQPIPLARDDWARIPVLPPDPEPTQPDDFAGPDEWARYWAARDRWLQQHVHRYQESGPRDPALLRRYCRPQQEVGGGYGCAR